VTGHELLDFFNRAIRPLKTRVMMSLGRAVVRAIEDDKNMQTMTVEVLKNEVLSKVERFQNYGFTSHPFEDAEAAVIFPQGSREHGIIIAVDDRRYRLKGLAKGEAAIYTDEGDKIVLKRGREIELTTLKLTINATNDTVINSLRMTVNASQKIDFNTPIATFSTDVEINGKVHVDQTVKADGNIESLSTVIGTVNVSTPATGGISLTGIKSAYNTHTHNENDNAPSPTNGPNQAI